MADINIQRKKSAPSPWILVLLVVLALAAAAYFFLRPDPLDKSVPAAGTSTEGLSTDAPPGAPTDDTRPAAPAAADMTADANSKNEGASVAALASQVATDPAAPNYATTGLQKLTSTLVALADRDDLRDPTITEQRDNLTSATSRLGEASTSLRPGFVAAAGLIRAMQQKAYPELESQANDLISIAGQVSGRSTTAAEQQQNQQFLTQAAAMVRTMSEPTQ
jgi:hypothetical protein